MTRRPDGPDASGPDSGRRLDGTDRADGTPVPAPAQMVPGETAGDRPGAQVEPEPEPAGPVATKVSDDEHNPNLKGLSKTLRKGATISAAMLFVTQVISLAQTVIVARLLSPAEIGVFTLGTLFANFLTAMAGGGMKAALIQREYDIEEAANTAFWASVATGVVMSTGALLASPLLGMFFDDQLVGLIAAVTSGTLLVHALLNVPEALMQRRFNFKRKLIVDPLTAGSFAVVTVTACALGFGVWGMVTGLYASQIATLIASWTLAGWRPGKARFVFSTWREMAKFSFPLIVQGVTSNFREIAQQAIVGRALDIPTAGQYRYGRRIGTLPGQAIIQVASYVLFPAFARISGDAVRFKRGFLRALRLLWTATIPLAALLVAIGGPAIVVLLGERWAPAGVFVAAMAGFGPGTALNAVGMESIKGAGKSKLLHWITGTSLVVGIGALVLLLPLGLLGVGLAASIDGLVCGLVTMGLAAPLVGLRWRELARVMVPPVGAAALAGVATWALEHYVLDAGSQGIVLGLVFLTAEFLLFVVVYLGTLALFAPATIVELRDLAQKFLQRRRGGGAAGVDAAADPDGPDQDPSSRRGEDDLLDAPTVILGLRWDPLTEQLVPADVRPVAPRPPGPPQGPPPGPPPATDGPHAATRELRPVPASVPPPHVDAPTTAIRPVGSPGHGNGHHGNGHHANGNGHHGNGNGHHGNGNGNGHRNGDGTGAGAGAGATNGNGNGNGNGSRRVVALTKVTRRKPD
ncbi:lipopolysaccharide biosynthesis protein [Actinomycetospora aeridis]|uniref:Lipopolysaccharide biosynthesis protein n=1 Tax=Actinomycetospora aeridis TaxID=3129231 RepID=A0ABU8N6R0_9PSEU